MVSRLYRIMRTPMPARRSTPTGLHGVPLCFDPGSISMTSQVRPQPPRSLCHANRYAECTCPDSAAPAALYYGRILEAYAT
jgi:hypothetical protein